MKPFLKIILLFIAYFFWETSLHATNIDQAGQNVFFNIISNGLVKVPEKKSIKKNDEEEVKKIQGETNELIKKICEQYQKGNLSVKEYTDALNKIEAPLIELQRNKGFNILLEKEISNIALDAKIVDLANIIIKKTYGQDGLDVNSKNKKGNQAYTIQFKNIKITNEEDFGNFSKEPLKVKIHTFFADKISGQTFFTMDLSIGGITATIVFSASWRFYTKSFNNDIFKNGNNAKPKNEYQYP